jgi:hypothetical protein
MWPFGKNDVPRKLGDRVWMNKQKKKPILTIFGAEKILDVLKKLEVKEDEMIFAGLTRTYEMQI